MKDFLGNLKEQKAAYLNGYDDNVKVSIRLFSKLRRYV